MVTSARVLSTFTPALSAANQAKPTSLGRSLSLSGLLQLWSLSNMSSSSFAQMTKARVVLLRFTLFYPDMYVLWPPLRTNALLTQLLNTG